MISDRDPRRWQERADGRLISKDMNAIANLPNEFINEQVYHNDPVYGPNSRYRGDVEMEMSFFEIIGSRSEKENDKKSKKR